MSHARLADLKVMEKHDQIKRFASLPLVFAIVLAHICFAHGASERAKIDLFIIIDVSKTVTECRNSCNILVESINCIYSTNNFEEHDRISTILVAGESLVEQPITVHKNESLLEGKRDGLVKEINSRRFVDLKTDLTNLKRAFEDLKTRRDQLRRLVSEGEDRNCAVLLISDGWHDEGSPDRKPPLEIENRKGLESSIDSIFQEDCSMAFFMFHIISPRRGFLYKDFWQCDVRQYDGIQCLGLYMEVRDVSLIQTSVREMIELLRKSQKINLKLDKEKSNTIIYSSDETNLIRIELQVDSTIPRDVVLTYKAKITEDDANVRIIPEQGQINVPANCVSLHPDPIRIIIKGKANVGDQYTALIDFNPDLPGVKISLREVPSVDIVTYEKPKPITFRLSKKGTIVFPTLAVYTWETVSVRATFWAPLTSSSDKLLFSVEVEDQSDLNNGVISEGLRQEFKDNNIALSDDASVSVKESDARWFITDGDKRYNVKKQKGKLNIYSDNIILTFLPFESLPPGLSLLNNTISLKQEYAQPISLKFNRRDVAPGMYKGKLIFIRPPSFPVVKEGYEDKDKPPEWNIMHLMFYNPSIWEYKLPQTLWILCMLFLIFMAGRYIYCYLKGIQTGKYKRLRVIDFNKKFNISIRGKTIAIVIYITDIVFVLWISLFFIWRYITPLSQELSIIFWLIIFFIVSIFWWVWGRKPFLNYKAITGVLQIIIALTQIMRLLVLVFRK